MRLDSSISIIIPSHTHHTPISISLCRPHLSSHSTTKSKSASTPDSQHSWLWWFHFKFMITNHQVSLNGAIRVAVPSFPHSTVSYLALSPHTSCTSYPWKLIGLFPMSLKKIKTIRTSSSSHRHSYLHTDTWPQELCLPAIMKDEFHLSAGSNPSHLLKDITLATLSLFSCIIILPLSTEGFLPTEKYAITFPILKDFIPWPYFFLHHCPISLLSSTQKLLRILVCICCFEFFSFDSFLNQFRKEFRFLPALLFPICFCHPCTVLWR